VQQHIGRNQVRAVAMSSTDAVVRGMEVTDTGSAITVPGRRDARARRILKRARRAGGQWCTDPEGRAALADPSQAPPTSSTSSRRRKVFETGIKVVDLIAPFVKGGKIGLFGGAGVGKTVVIMELINKRREGTRRVSRCSAA